MELYLAVESISDVIDPHLSYLHLHLTFSR